VIQPIEFIRWLVKVSIWDLVMFDVYWRCSSELNPMVPISVSDHTLTNVEERIDYSGSLTYLVDYERQRQVQSLSRLLSIDSLNRLYSTHFMPLVALRSVGLSFVNEFSPIKVIITLQMNQRLVDFFLRRNSSPNKHPTAREREFVHF
jgi:hypothetical protein